MENNNRVKNVLNYYVMCNKLKNIVRSGWKIWKVDRDRLESVAEHIFGVQSLAIAMYSEYNYDLDINKILFMIAVHELEEIIIGDLTIWDITSEEKKEIGHKAVSEILSNLVKKEEIQNLVLEFDERKTRESIFAYHCDKLECDLQCKLYDEENCVDINNQENNRVYHDEKLQNIIKEGNKSWSSIWLEFDRNLFEDDLNFIEILEYTKNNKIS